MSGPAAGEEAIMSTETLRAETTTPSTLSWFVGADHQVVRLLLLLTGTELEGALDTDDIRELVLPPPGELFTVARGKASLIRTGCLILKQINSPDM